MNELTITFIRNTLRAENYILKTTKIKDTNPKITFICPNKHRGRLSWAQWKSGKRCRKCRIVSNGVLKIIQCLNGIKYSLEHKIPECRNIQPLPFDFAIFNEKEELLGLIEFNGIQHYKAVRKFGGKKALVGQIKRDGIKEQYCIDNNIPLLLVRYDQADEIPEIIEKFLQDIVERQK